MAKHDSKRTPRKSRQSETAPRLTFKVARYSDAPGHSSHMGGEFADAGYRAGRGGFGFTQDMRKNG